MKDILFGQNSGLFVTSSIHILSINIQSTDTTQYWQHNYINYKK